MFGMSKASIRHYFGSKRRAYRVRRNYGRVFDGLPTSIFNQGEVRRIRLGHKHIAKRYL